MLKEFELSFIKCYIPILSRFKDSTIENEIESGSFDILGFRQVMALFM